jgi:hypothetical protein
MRCCVAILLTIGILFFSAQAYGAASVQINTSKYTYNYGDYLSVTIKVSEVTGSDATMYIIDSNETKSTAIPIKLRDKTTTIVAQSPFDPVLFKEGKYKIQLDYDGTKTFLEFELVDAGNILMPFGSNVVVPQWFSGTISDYNFLKFLVDMDTILLPPDEPLKNSVKIPSWYKINARWWFDKMISDNEFVAGLQYLIDKKIVD